MKKPAVLLVGVDDASLASLARLLQDNLAPIARIVAVPGSARVVDALDQLEAENRKILVAVLDEDMPRVNGVQVALLLRERSHARECKTVILAEDADLLKAMEAKNEARISRYLQKPWSSDAMLRAVAELLWQALVAIGAEEYIEFREAKTVREIEDSLRLSFDVYRQCPDLAAILPADTDGLDVGPYDKRSRFFGLYQVREAEVELVGTLRMTGSDETDAAAALDSIAARRPGVRQALDAGGHEDWPMLEWAGNRRAVERALGAASRAGGITLEPRRLAVAPAARGSGALQTALFLILCATAQGFFVIGASDSLLGCAEHHRRLYVAYGFETAEGTEPEHSDHLNAVKIILHGRQEWVTGDARTKCQTVATRIRRYQQACHCPEFSNCLDGPYATGRFTDTDIFCPVLAKRRLASLRRLERGAVNGRGS